MFLGKNFQFFPKNTPKMREEREKMKFFLSPPAPSYTVTNVLNNNVSVEVLFTLALKVQNVDTNGLFYYRACHNSITLSLFYDLSAGLYGFVF